MCLQGPHAAITYRSTTVSAGKRLLSSSYVFTIRIVHVISPSPLALLKVSLCLALSPHRRFCASHSCPPLRIVSYDSSSLLSTYVPPSPGVVVTSTVCLRLKSAARSRRPCPARNGFCSRANGVPSPLVPGFPTWLMNVTDPDGPWSGSPSGGTGGGEAPCNIRVRLDLACV